MKREWIINEKSNSKTSTSLVERLLATRGITNKEEINEFLNPLEIKISHPNVFMDMQKAIDRLSKAIDAGENILIYGDFDADGVTSTSLLIRTLTHLGANVSYFIPDREKEGHGLNSKALIKQMTIVKPKIIITVDCGVSDVEQIDFINSFKIDVIITDHHEAPEELPKALAIINPKAQNALDENLSTKEILYLTSLAGVGVAFKLAQALLEYYKKLDFIYDLLPYVAVGTVADVVPLIGENRYFVAKGLELISNARHYGLKRLLESAGYTLEQGITSENIAFGVAPRINASGRLDTVDEAIKLLISDNNQEIEMAIISLNNFNNVRQELCNNVFLEAEEMLKNQGNSDSSIILFNPKWHIGIIGIVASKLVEKYHKPTLLMTYSEETKQVRCSARSIKGIHLYEILSLNPELFDGFGGHEMAAGLSFNTDKITFEQVKATINTAITEALGGKVLVPILNVDMELKPSEVDIELVGEIDKLQPFGAANSNPIFVMNGLKVAQKKLMGSNKNHLKLTVEDSQGNLYDCIRWSKGDVSLEIGDTLDIAFCPQLNTYNGSTSIQLILQDIHADNLVDEKPELNIAENSSEIKIYDHRKKTDIMQSVNDYVRTSKLNIKIFAEDKRIMENLKAHKSLSERIFNRNSIEDTQVLMFFDYPSTPELLGEIIEKTNPKYLHFMNYELKKFDEKELLKLFSGMLKFTHNNKDGKFELDKSAAFLALPSEAVTTLLDVFEDCNLIEILDKTVSEYKINFSSNIELSKALHSSFYKEFLSLVNEVEEYKKSFKTAELDSFLN